MMDFLKDKSDKAAKMLYQIQKQRYEGKGNESAISKLTQLLKGEL